MWLTYTSFIFLGTKATHNVLNAAMTTLGNEEEIVCTTRNTYPYIFLIKHTTC